MITGSGFGESSLPQNLGSGQRKRGHPASWGSVVGDRSVGKMIVKLPYQFPRTLCCDDNEKAAYTGDLFGFNARFVPTYVLRHRIEPSTHGLGHRFCDRAPIHSGSLDSIPTEVES